jgi:hypothetical protein
VVIVDGLASLYLERGGRGVIALREADGTWEESAVSALVEELVARRGRRLAVGRYPDELGEVLQAAGFTPTPKGLVRYG